jgi:fucose 4-O-acetylase-like acetyltransferase
MNLISKIKSSTVFNSSLLEKNRYLWVDYLRGIVIILVVYHHAFIGMERSGIAVPKVVGDANMIFYSFRMPLFFVISGIFTGLSLASKSVKRIVWGKFNLLFYPYVVWSALQITLQIFLSNYTNSDRTFFDYLYILYQPKQLDQFWYLPALFNATLVFLLIKTKFHIKPGYHLLTGIAFYLISPFISEISMMSNWMRFYVFFVIGDVLSAFVIKKEVQFQLKRSVYFLGVIPVFLLAQYYYFYHIGLRSLENESANLHTRFAPYVLSELGFLITSLVGCTTFFLFSFLLEKWNRLKWLRVVGFHSLYIYIMHVIVAAFIRMIFTKLFGIDNYLVILFTGILFGVTIPIAFYNLIGKKYLWFLFSARKNLKQDFKVKQANLRSTEVRLASLQSSVNNI